MKTLMKTAVLFTFCALFSMNLSAFNDTDGAGTLIFNTTAVDADRVKVHLANLNRSTTYVTLNSLEGKSFYSERISGRNGYLQVLDISKLPAGRYVLEVMHNGKTHSSVVLIDETNVWLSQVSTQ